MGVDDVLDVRARLGAIGVVLALVDDFDLLALDGGLDALQALRRVVGREHAHEDGDLPALGKQRDDALAERLSGVEVVRADVEQALGLVGVGVEGDEVGLARDLVEHAQLVVRSDDADGDGVVALAREVLQDLVLIRGRAVRRHLQVDLNLGFLLVLLDAGLGELPELARVVGDEARA